MSRTIMKHTYIVLSPLNPLLYSKTGAWSRSVIAPVKRNIQGPVVQSVVSLTSTLRVISLTVLADSIYNIMIFFAEKMWVAFAMQKLLTFFQQKISAYTRITWSKF